MEEEKVFCAVCNIELINHIKDPDPYPGWQCCEKHSKYKHISYFMIPFLQKELGLPYKEELKFMQEGTGAFKFKLNCSVCDKKLTKEEINNIKSTDANFYCKEHEEIKFCFNDIWAKGWFFYKKEINTNAVAVKYDEFKYSEDWNKFSKWFLSLSYEQRNNIRINRKLTK